LEFIHAGLVSNWNWGAKLEAQGDNASILKKAVQYGCNRKTARRRPERVVEIGAQTKSQWVTFRDVVSRKIQKKKKKKTPKHPPPKEMANRTESGCHLPKRRAGRGDGRLEQINKKS